MALLAAEALGLGDGDPGHSDLVQRFLDLVELERFDDCLDLLHLIPCPGLVRTRERRTAFTIPRHSIFKNRAKALRQGVNNRGPRRKGGFARMEKRPARWANRNCASASSIVGKFQAVAAR